VSQYELLNMIGEGASAVSYLAQDEQGAEVVVKRYKTAFYQRESVFYREVEVLRSLVHPQIPRYIDSYIEKIDGRSLPHIVQEYVHGESMALRLKQQRPTEEEALDWIQQLLGVLSYLHALRPPVIHRDIKPSNILLREGQLVLIDFGLAIDDLAQTMGHTMGVGTLGYQSPEQISGYPTIRSDLYSVGALTIELFTGIHPKAMLSAGRLRWEEKCIDLPTSLQRWLDKMLDEEQSHRFPNAQAALAALPLRDTKINVVQSSRRNPTSAEVPKDFLASLAAKEEQKRKEEGQERRRQLEKEETECRAKEEEERKRIASVRQKRAAERHQDALWRQLKEEEETLISELEQAWEIGVAKVTGQTLDADDLLQAMRQSFMKRSVLKRETLEYYVRHPLILICGYQDWLGRNIAMILYWEWVFTRKCTGWTEQKHVQELQQQLRQKQLELESKKQQLKELSWLASWFQQEELQQERKKREREYDDLKLMEKKEREQFYQYCFDIYWEPFFETKPQDVQRKWEQLEQQYQAEIQNQEAILSKEQFFERVLKQEQIQKKREEDIWVSKFVKNLDLKKMQSNPQATRKKRRITRKGRHLGLKDLVEIQPGRFEMGALSTDHNVADIEKPSHWITLTHPFLIFRYPCTQKLYELVMGMNPSFFRGAKHPVEKVSWCDAILFCNRLSEMEGLEPCYVFSHSFENTHGWAAGIHWKYEANGYRLPTEAEWEYCARGGEYYKYSGSNNLDEVGWYAANSDGKTQSVGRKKPNGYGLYDMSGNVYEWVWDTGFRVYGSAETNPVFIQQGSTVRGCRGGSVSDSASFLRVSARSSDLSHIRYINRGFRFVRGVSD